jgi:hypothetical protein
MGGEHEPGDDHHADVKLGNAGVSDWLRATPDAGQSGRRTLAAVDAHLHA